MCCGVIPILFAWFLRVPSVHALVLIQKAFCDLSYPAIGEQQREQVSYPKPAWVVEWSDILDSMPKLGEMSARWSINYLIPSLAVRTAIRRQLAWWGWSVEGAASDSIAVWWTLSVRLSVWNSQQVLYSIHLYLMKTECPAVSGYWLASKFCTAHIFLAVEKLITY